ncbi:ABC transporter ATP-binding protein [Agathobacter ruminis]|uniref:Sugar ABC transporter ATP-binding protein n=1 Tax=Agathobacter ruminis TaxID=1712665 RepID=A0A2G3E154_9FIRM|nr:ABC transporter ATP-binding protein [Agathobacter ruminis]MDC7301971.1 ABC transporter ATP-binding protein/permease [Agathobacter ruminis]PHU37016.1 sugar ABC transporter ATP-binding protein [Agathobacter ruminis]
MKNKKQKETLRKIFHYMRRYLWLFFLSVLCAVAVVALTLLFPILTGKAIDLIVAKGQVDFERLRMLVLQTGAVVLLTAILQWILNMINNTMTYRIVRDIRRDAFYNMGRLPLGYIDSHSHGDMVSRIIADVDTFADGLLMGMTQLVTGLMTILGTIGFMIMIDWRVTLVVILVTPLSMFVASFIAKRTFSMFQLQSQMRGKQTALIQETIANQKTVIAFGREQKQCEQFDEINENLRKCSLRATFFSSTVNPSTRFINSLVYAGVGVCGAILAMSGGISVGQLQAFLSYASQYTKPFNEISGVVTEMQNAIACAGRIFELIEAEPETPESPDCPALEAVKGHVIADHVSFSYHPDQPLIEDFCLDVTEGSRIAIVGPTGCGKTTLINLLMRFYETDKGAFFIDGQASRNVSRHSLRTSFGMVLQETWLRHGTIRENIIMGKPDATDEEVIEAAKASHAHSFIQRLPKGYDTIIGEDGGSLSQGQKQLLCITRVMLALPPMLILDEATSSIDTRTEMRIQKAFMAMSRGRTCFIVAHRLSTIEDADLILVMKDGKIIEQGNHETLLLQHGFYEQLYNSQFAH